MPLFSFRVCEKITDEVLAPLGEIVPPGHESHEQPDHNRQDQTVIDRHAVLHSPSERR